MTSVTGKVWVVWNTRHSPQLSPCLPHLHSLPISSTSPFPTFPLPFCLMWIKSWTQLPLLIYCLHHYASFAYRYDQLGYPELPLLALLLEFLVNLLLYNTPSDPRVAVCDRRCCQALLESPYSPPFFFLTLWFTHSSLYPSIPIYMTKEKYVSILYE